MIRAQNLVKRFGKVTAVDGVSLELHAGDSLAIFGPSGGGKTTLLRLIAGLDLPDDGRIYLNGTLMSEPGGAVPPHQRGIGFAFQATALWPHMTVAENILFGLHEISKPESKERLREMLSRIGLEGFEDRHPAELSGGESRRVALARTLAPAPKILLLDEPLTNIDPDLKTRLMKLVIETVAQEKMTLIYVSHDHAEAAEIAGDNLIEMKDGRLGP